VPSGGAAPTGPASQLAGVPYKHLAVLSGGDIAVRRSIATIRSATEEWTLRPADDGLLCGPCSVVRWLRILDLAVTKPEHQDHRPRSQARTTRRPPVTARLPHRADTRRHHHRRAVAAADRSVGRPSPPDRAFVAAFAVPPCPGPPRRGPRRAPRSARRPRRRTDGNRPGESAGDRAGRQCLRCGGRDSGLGPPPPGFEEPGRAHRRRAAGRRVEPPGGGPGGGLALFDLSILSVDDRKGATLL